MRSTAAGKETEIATNESPGRSTLSSRQARQRYVEIAELAVLEQIQRDAETLDRESIAVGPFVRLDSNAVAAKDGKTRGTISNLFGSQSAFQAETMALALSARDWIAHIEYPSPGDYPTADAWVDAFFAAESARGPHRGLDPRVSYAFLWSIWLSLVPYGLWSERIRQPSMEEHVQWLDRLEEVLRDALEHFGLVVRTGTVNDLAGAIASLVEGVWLNQCLTDRHPSDPSEPISTLLRRSGRMLWLGATGPRDEPGER